LGRTDWEQGSNDETQGRLLARGRGCCGVRRVFEHRNTLWNCGLNHDICLRYRATFVGGGNGSDDNHR
jgi:hypothetical protein